MENISYKNVGLFQKTELLHKEKHSNLKWRCLGKDCELSCCCIPHRATITINEVIPLSRFFPVVFVRTDNEDGTFLESINIYYKLPGSEGCCIYLDPNLGCMLGDKKPIACKQYPFMVQQDGKNNMFVNIDLTCPGFSYTEGQSVLDEEGNVTSYFMEEFLNPSIAHIKNRKETEDFIRQLLELDLIREYYAHFNNQKIVIQYRAVDFERLLKLSDKDFKMLALKGYLSLIYAHLHSIQNLSLLVEKAVITQR